MFRRNGLERVTVLEVPCFQPLLSVKGSLKELEAAVSAAASHAIEGETVWLEIVISADDYLSDLQSRIQKITEDLPVEVLRIRRERSSASEHAASPSQGNLERTHAR